MAPRPHITDPFYRELNETLAGFDARLAQAMPFALRQERHDMLRLIAGVSVVMQMGAGHVPDVAQLNAVLAARLGNGSSWFSSLQYLAGARARETFAKREALLATLVDPGLLKFAAQALPTMPETMKLLMAQTSGVQAAQAARAARFGASLPGTAGRLSTAADD
ncbi:hypothetical protein [Cupriavidus pampae]|uniref:Uncharacterized protein n=1 Tax=Cupriavidus pampae TaxID=659251 RepID=A0ABN7ZF94_9BURK|nr:hypothetical protein [Cupriavidus pampae]CAG9183878.1 hypothetical protein LMG32289_05451 [Cupriavidus pampae]